MLKNLKPLIFAIAGVSFTCYVLSSIASPIKKGEKFGDWIYACDNNSKCFLSQTLLNEEKKAVMQIRIGKFIDSKLTMLQILPLGLSIPHGTSLISESGDVFAPGVYNTCNEVGCIAALDLSDETLERILQESKLFIGTIKFSEGKTNQINFPFTAHGLKEAIKAIKNSK